MSFAKPTITTTTVIPCVFGLRTQTKYKEKEAINGPSKNDTKILLQIFSVAFQVCSKWPMKHSMQQSYYVTGEYLHGTLLPFKTFLQNLIVFRAIESNDVEGYVTCWLNLLHFKNASERVPCSISNADPFQCDQIGRFSSVLCDFLQIAQMYSVFWAILKKVPFEIKTDLATFWATFEKNWATFNFSIWSHWPLPTFAGFLY